MALPIGVYLMKAHNKATATVEIASMDRRSALMLMLPWPWSR
jgi:hypothetical protein